MIAIEGIIGAGKTYLVRRMQELYPDYYVFFMEPVEENPYLIKFCKDPSKWALEMQFWCMCHRYQQHLDAVEMEWKSNGTKCAIFDRSIYGDAAFAYLLHDAGLISESGYIVYLKMREMMTRTLLTPQLVVYLDVDIDIAMKRIEMRGRKYEESILPSYQEGLHKAYMTQVLPPLQKVTRVKVVNWNNTNASIEDVLS